MRRITNRAHLAAFPFLAAVLAVGLLAASPSPGKTVAATAELFVTSDQ